VAMVACCSRPGRAWLGYGDFESILINMSVVCALVLSTFIGLFFSLGQDELIKSDFSKLLMSNPDFRLYVANEIDTFPTLPRSLNATLGVASLNALEMACQQRGSDNCLVTYNQDSAHPGDISPEWWIATRAAQHVFPPWKTRAFMDVQNPWDGYSPWGNSRALHFFVTWTVAVNVVALMGSVMLLGSLSLLDARPDDGDSDTTQAHKSTKYNVWTLACLPITVVIFLVMIAGIVLGFTVTVWVAYVRFPQEHVG